MIEEIVAAFAGIVLAKTASKAAGFHANGGIDRRIVTVIPVEDLEGDGVFLDPERVALKGSLNDVAQKALAALPR